MSQAVDPDKERPIPADFGSRVAHEIRSPLNLVAGALSEFEGADDAARQRLLQLARRGVAKLGRFADRLSLLSRIETGSVQVASGRTDLREIVESATCRAQNIVGRRRVEVAVSGDPSLWLQADPSLVGLAIQELVENALRHGRRSVEVRVVAADGTARVEVTDDGPGVPDEVHETMFARHGSESPRGGLHVGLAIARTLARRHGGEVELAESIPGERTTFVMHLPFGTRASHPG